jgi:hypothetical protein
MFRLIGLLAVALTANLTPAHAGDLDLGGSVALEVRAFGQTPAWSGQSDDLQTSLVLEGDFRWRSADRRHQWVFAPWARYDSLDDGRTHADLREGFYRYSGDTVTVEAGLIKVFWGVTESRHLIDIINQTDGVEDIDGEDKLGQPAFRLSHQRDWGLLEFFVLPAFRERTFSGVEGRQRGPLFIDTDQALYDDSDGDTHIDLAARWSHYLGNWDIGVAGFHGTSREPVFRMGPQNDRLLPLYSVISQASVDIQYTSGAWLWKFEGLVRSGQGDDFGAAVAGVEYTFYGVTETGADFGVLVEYLWDDRDPNGFVAPVTGFDDDLFVGGRYALNDMNDSSVLGGAVIDLNNGSIAIFLEAERRIGDNYFVELEGRFYAEIDPGDPLAALEQDDSLTLRVTRHF